MRLDGVEINNARLDGVDINEARLNGSTVFSSSPLYVQSGLMAMFKGDAKTKESVDKTVWKNLAGETNLNLWNFGNMEGSGWTGQSLYFDGVDDTTSTITLPDNVLTLECVFKMPEYKGGRNPISNRFLNTSNGSGLKGMSLGTQTYNDGSNYTKFLLWHGVNTSSIDSVIPLDTRLNFTVTFDPSNTTFYVYYNGVLKKTVVNAAYEAHNQIVIGNWATNHATFKWSGDIFCARVYNRYLTPTEVSDNYNIDKEVYGI